jgi:GNAT superfamily N-acetyltransferase
VTLEPVRVCLEDGTSLTIRAICPGDANSLIAMHERLSDHSLQMRYLSNARQPLINQSARTCAIDPVSHMALVAIPDHLLPEQIVAVAEYTVPDRNNLCSADIGIVVEDIYQHRGMGSVLLTHLVIWAQAHGICELTADIAYENHAILSFVRQTALPHHASICDGLIHVTITLTQELSGLGKRLGEQDSPTQQDILN